MYKIIVIAALTILLSSCAKERVELSDTVTVVKSYCKPSNSFLDVDRWVTVIKLSTGRRLTIDGNLYADGDTFVYTWSEWRSTIKD